MTLPKPDPSVPAEHGTLVFERDIRAAPGAVFAAFADARRRADWGTPSPTAVVLYDAEDFREGGEDRYRCGARENPDIQATTRYLEIIDGRRIVSSETLVMAGVRLCASLTTVELIPRQGLTRVRNTTQLVSFVGPSMADGFRQGTDAALDNLVRHVEAGATADG